jgi:hypothetical protein
MNSGWAKRTGRIQFPVRRQEGGADSVSLWMFLRIAAERFAEEATYDRQAGAK